MKKMPQKRLQQEDDGRPLMVEDGSTSGYNKRLKPPSFTNFTPEVMCQAFQQYIVPNLEPLIRRVVKEEIDLAFQKHMTSMERNSGNEIQPAALSLKLQFLDTVSLPVFTGSRIEAEDSKTMRVSLIDADTGQVVTNGPISSARVEIVVLEGDFNADLGENWTPEEFNRNLLKERQGKKALLSGDAVLNLEEGSGLLGDIHITDNSRWTRSRKFRLGARVLDDHDGVRVGEAITDPFVVREHRGELYKKHHPPSLSDEVWRLEKIGKEGAFNKRLSKEGINTVRDFLILLYLDPARLRYILGGMSPKMLEVTVEHARTCVLNKRAYLYCPRSYEKNGVVFNVVGQLMGLLRAGQYILVDQLSEAEKVDASNLVIVAFRNWKDVVAFDDEASFLNGCSLLSSVNYPSNLEMAGTSDAVNISTSDHVGSFEHPQLDVSTPDILASIFSAGDADNMGDLSLQDIENMVMDVNFDQNLSFPDNAGPTAHSLRPDEHIWDIDATFSFQSRGHADLHSPVSQGPSVATVTISKAQRRWRMLFCVLRWFSVRRIVAQRSMLRRRAS